MTDDEDTRDIVIIPKLFGTKISVGPVELFYHHMMCSATSLSSWLPESICDSGRWLESEVGKSGKRGNPELDFQPGPISGGLAGPVWNGSEPSLDADYR